MELIITSSEFRNNQKKYFDIAEKTPVFVTRAGKNPICISSLPLSEIELYYSNPKVREALKEAIEQIKSGETYEMLPGESLEDFIKKTDSCVE